MRISPTPGLSDYMKLFGNVKSEEVPYVINNTYSQTVTRISHIRSLYGIEREFDRYYERLKNKMDAKFN